MLKKVDFFDIMQSYTAVKRITIVYYIQGYSKLFICSLEPGLLLYPCIYTCFCRCGEDTVAYVYQTITMNRREAKN